MFCQYAGLYKAEGVQFLINRVQVFIRCSSCRSGDLTIDPLAITTDSLSAPTARRESYSAGND